MFQMRKMYLFRIPDKLGDLGRETNWAVPRLSEEDLRGLGPNGEARE